MSELAVLAEVLGRRKSVRGFAPEPLPRGLLEELFAAAQRAPSWCNTQPWRVVVTAPPLTGEVSEALLAAAKGGFPGPEIAFPIDYPEPYGTHRRVCGGALYRAMGVARDDKEGRYQAWLRNYQIFGAPHLAVVARDRRLGEYATLDVGVWLGTLLACASALGVASCPMASIAAYPEPLRRLLDLPAEQVVLCGVALGREDVDVPANACRTSRDPIASNVRFVGFRD